MEENTLNELVRLTKAVRALSKTVERNQWTGTGEGTGAMVVKSYRSLHKKATELLPGDYYVTEGLALDIRDSASDEEMVAQVRVASSQLAIYLSELIRSERPPFDEAGDWSSIGRDIQEQILNLTKRTLKRALTNVEWGFKDEENTDDDSNSGPKKKKRMRIDVSFGGAAQTTEEPDNDEAPPSTL